MVPGPAISNESSWPDNWTHSLRCSVTVVVAVDGIRSHGMGTSRDICCCCCCCNNEFEWSCESLGAMMEVMVGKDGVSFVTGCDCACFFPLLPPNLLGYKEMDQEEWFRLGKKHSTPVQSTHPREECEEC